MPHFRLAALVLVMTSGTALAADMLPLKNGIFVPVGRACKGASNADIVNYWGGRTSIGTSQGDCTIKSLKKVGNTYTINDVCKSLDGQIIGGGPTVVRIKSPTEFSLATTTLRYCGPKVEF